MVVALPLFTLLGMGGGDGLQSDCNILIDDDLLAGAGSVFANAFGGGRGGLSLSAEDNF